MPAPPIWRAFWIQQHTRNRTLETPADPLEWETFGKFRVAASLARLKLRIFFEEMFKRIPDVRVTGKPSRIRGTFFNSYVRLPVEYTPN